MRGILALLVLASVCGATFSSYIPSCRCRRTSDEKKYCMAEVVLKIKVRGNLKSPSGGRDAFEKPDEFYKAKVKQIWKYPDIANIPPLEKKIKLYTDSGNICVKLQKGQEYIVSGRWHGPRGLKLDSCDSIISPLPIQSPMKGWKKNPPNCELIRSYTTPSTSSSTTMEIFHDYFSSLY